MNWVDVLWPVMGGACLTLGLVHLLLWWRQRALPHLLFFLTAISVAAVSVYELMMMHATTPEEYGLLLRWAHVPGALLFIAVPLYVQARFSASRLSLCIGACAARVVALVLNFTTGVNINYLEIHALREVPLPGGGLAAVPEGVPNPAMLMGQVNVVLMVALMVDTILRSRRLSSPEEAERAARICGSIALFLIAVDVWRVGVVTGTFVGPDVLVPTFMCVLLIMSLELSRDIMRAGQLSTSLDETRSQLRENEQRMEVAVRAAEIGPWSWDLERDEFWFSPLAMQILGLPPDRPYDREAMRARIHPEDLSAAQDALEQASRSAGDYRAEYRLRPVEGDDWRWIAARGQLEFERPGVPARMFGIVADITDRKQHEERFQLAVEAAPTAMLMVDEAGVITLCNRQAQELFGYPEVELLGLQVDRLVPDPLAGRHAHLRAGFVQAPSARSMGAGRELHARRKDGTQVPVEVALNPISVHGRRQVLASVTDISKRRALERESALHRDELAHLSRVALLAELSGSLAHELNQPLTAILSNAQAATRFLARDPPDLQEVRDSLVNIVDSDRRAGEVIRRLRAMLRRETPDHMPLDLNEVVNDVLRIIRSDLLNRNTETVLDLAPNLPAVHGDRIQLQQVLLNLIMNGCDAMAEIEGQREIVLRTRFADGQVRVSVTDCGRGIADEDLERIFSPFVTTKSEGLGLGLAVCTTIIESHRGRLWATSGAGQGATLHFGIPAGDAA